MFRQRLESWYHTNADRLTGTFKRTKAFPLTIITAVILVILLNADSIEISRYLYTHKTAASNLSEMAMSRLKDYGKAMEAVDHNSSLTSSEKEVTIDDLNAQALRIRTEIDSLNALNLPWGWQHENITSLKAFGSYAGKHGIGWLATILAVMMGAPFWFDVLNKI